MQLVELRNSHCNAMACSTIDYIIGNKCFLDMKAIILVSFVLVISSVAMTLVCHFFLFHYLYTNI